MDTRGMTSAIDSTLPVSVSPTTASVRTNFATAKSEISALQAGTGTFAGGSISGQLVTATGATTALTLAVLHGWQITPQMFGAAGDGTTDDTAAVALWWTYISTHSVEGYVPAGTYKLVGQVTWDIGATNRTKGVKVTGAGPRLAVFSLTTTSSPALLITNSNVPGDTFYCTFRDFGITTAVAGTGVRIGLASFADPFNSSTWDNLVINNTSTSASAIALETNYLCNCHVSVVANCGGHGTAVKVNHSVFCEYRGAYDSADIGLNLATDYTYGCTFQAIDFETVAACVQIDSANATKNLFLGGTFVYTGATCLIGNAGSANLFINPNISGSGANISGSGIQTLIGGTLAGGALTVSSGGVTLTSGNLTVTSGNATLTSGNLAVSSGTITASGNISTSNGTVATTTTSGNTFTMAGAASGSDVALTASGVDAAVAVAINSKGTGSVKLVSNGITSVFATSTGALIGNTGQSIGFYGATRVAKQTVTGSRGANAALASLLTALATLGLITDSTS
jgi:hypothetical protein